MYNTTCSSGLYYTSYDSDIGWRLELTTNVMVYTCLSMVTIINILPFLEEKFENRFMKELRAGNNMLRIVSHTIGATIIEQSAVTCNLLIVGPTRYQ